MAHVFLFSLIVTSNKSAWMKFWKVAGVVRFSYLWWAIDVKRQFMFPSICFLLLLVAYCDAVGFRPRIPFRNGLLSRDISTPRTPSNRPLSTELWRCTNPKHHWGVSPTSGVSHALPQCCVRCRKCALWHSLALRVASAADFTSPFDWRMGTNSTGGSKSHLYNCAFKW